MPVLNPIPPVAIRRAEKIHALTSLRFFAAFYVVLFHTTWIFLPSWTERGGVVNRVVSMGYISVSFFFLLSGYILAMVYLRDGRDVPLRKFYVARFARVYPLFFLTLVLDTPFLIGIRIAHYGLKSAVLKTVVTFIANLAMLQAWVMKFRGINNPNWSMSVETFFYLVFPFIGVLLWKLRGRSIWLIMLLVYLCAPVMVYLAIPHFSQDAVKFQPLLHLPTFVLGILLARVQVLARQRGNAPPRSESALAVITVLFALACFGAAVYLSPRISMDYFNDGLLAPVFACVIWAFSGSKGWPVRLLSVRWLVVLGEASFGLYLFQFPVLHLFQAIGWDKSPMFYPLYLAVSVGVSLLSFYYFETPMRKWILGRLHTRSFETMEASSDAQ